MASILSLTDGVCLATGDTSSSSVELSFFSILCKFMSSSSTTLEKNRLTLSTKFSVEHAINQSHHLLILFTNLYQNSCQNFTNMARI